MEPKRPIPIALRCRDVRVDRAALRLLIARVLESEGVPERSGCSLILGGDRFVRRLNRSWRGLDRTTDVLSFPAGDEVPLPPEADEPDGRTLGEIVISAPQCLRQAEAAGVVPGVEMARLTIHGVLHLLGYDHERPRDREAMQPRERRLRRWARRAGVGAGLLRKKR